jgi:hypothetical protein
LKMNTHIRRAFHNGIQRHIVIHIPWKPKEGEFKAEGDMGECAICQESIRIGHTFKRLPCSDTVNHCFHSECINPWIQSHNTCPICRANVL